MSETPEINSPLTMDKTDSIGDLFDRDPITWTDEEVKSYVLVLREQRKQLDVDQKPKTAAKKTTVAKAKLDSGMSLLDVLGLNVKAPSKGTGQ